MASHQLSHFPTSQVPRRGTLLGLKEQVAVLRLHAVSYWPRNRCILDLLERGRTSRTTGFGYRVSPRKGVAPPGRRRWLSGKARSEVDQGPGVGVFMANFLELRKCEVRLAPTPRFGEPPFGGAIILAGIIGVLCT